MRIANQVAILSLTRIASYGLMLVSPIVLVRLFSVEEFGRYREFLLYAGLTQAIASFTIPDSLLYFVAAHPRSPWRLVRQCAQLTFITSAVVAVALAAGNTFTHGGLVGPYLAPLLASTLLSVNLDFWEYFWIARGRMRAVFAYSAGRLLARLLTVIAAAALTHSVRVTIWAFVSVEALRFAGSAIALYRSDGSAGEPPLEHPWRDFFRFCLPSGAALLLQMLSRNASNIAVVRMLGSAALAQYAIGGFAEPVVTTLRNSVSTAVLPAMVHRDRLARSAAVALWQQGTVVNTILLFPAAVLVGRYAPILVTSVFGRSYAQAAIVMQLYMLVVLRECFDFAPALRAAGRTAPLVASNFASLAVCVSLLPMLVPWKGVAGAMIAYAVAAFSEATVLAWTTRAVYGIALRALIPWARIAKVALAAAVAALVLLGSASLEVPALLGVAIFSALYLVVFVVLLLALRVPEAHVLLDWTRRMAGLNVVRGA